MHVFPEGVVHQHGAVDVRYFKWGVARLILEAEPAPDVVPMFVDGTQRVMPEDRGFPRFLPRPGQRVRVAFGDVLDYERTFGDLRRRWDRLVRRECERLLAAGADAGAGAGADGAGIVREGGVAGKGAGAGAGTGTGTATGTGLVADGKKPGSARSLLLPGELPTDELKYGREAQEIRIEVARRMRDEILKVRRSLGGYPEPDPTFGFAETWAPDNTIAAKKYKSRVDGSHISQD